MNTKEIMDASRNGKTFNLCNVKLVKVGGIKSENGTFVDVTFKASAHFNTDVIDFNNDVLDFDNIEVYEKPKYDPCRKFKAGDIVKPRMVDGRKEFHFNDGDILKVCRDEDDYNMVSVENQDGVGISTNALFLELVTPVEERMPYLVCKQDGKYYVLQRCGHLENTFILMANYDNNHPNPKKAADAECKRLNAEWRNGQNN